MPLGISGLRSKRETPSTLLNLDMHAVVGEFCMNGLTNQIKSVSYLGGYFLVCGFTT